MGGRVASKFQKTWNGLVLNEPLKLWFALIIILSPPYHKSFGFINLMQCMQTSVNLVHPSQCQTCRSLGILRNASYPLREQCLETEGKPFNSIGNGSHVFLKEVFGLQSALKWGTKCLEDCLSPHSSVLLSIQSLVKICFPVHIIWHISTWSMIFHQFLSVSFSLYFYTAVFSDSQMKT